MWQVFHQCGTPPHAPARTRRAPAPREEVGRLWAAAAALEEQPTTAAGTSLPRLVSGTARAGGLAGGRWGALQLPPLSARPGVGAPRATGPREGLLGWTAPDGVWRPPHGGGHLAGGGALLDGSWAGPVRPGRWLQRVSQLRGRVGPGPAEASGLLCSQVRVASGRGLPARAAQQPRAGCGNFEPRRPDAEAAAAASDGHNQDAGCRPGSRPGTGGLG